MLSIAIEFLSLFWLFGALVFWPVMRFVVRLPPETLRELKWQFGLQAAGLVVTSGLVLYFRETPSHVWLHTMFLPHAVGVLGWITALVILFTIAMRRGEG